MISFKKGVNMSWANKNVLVTGGLGFIGSHLVEKLVSLGANVTAVDIVNENNISNLEGIKDSVKILNCDVSNLGDVKSLPNFDVIFHLAAFAYPKFCEDNPELAFRTNVDGVFNILNHARKTDVKRFIFTSTAQLYGRYPKYIPIDEQHPIDFSESVYNLTKFYGENLCTLFYEKYGLPVTFFRLFNTFGPRQGPEYFIPTVILQALTKNVVELWSDKPTRDFTYVADTVNALISAAESDHRGGPINIGSGDETRVADIAKHIADKLNAELKFLNKDVIGSMRLCCDNSYARRHINWKPEVAFKDGLNKTIEWYKNNLSKFKP
jgi:nucleoside-diphosphate-sugar epimerase